jgi:glycosyltransferase involved in cell wall biosynthesis
MPVPIALVITELEPGGAERCLVELALRLDPAAFSAVVYSLAPLPAASRRMLVERLEAADVPVHFLGLSRPWEYFRGVRQLATLLGEQQPGLVQTFLFHANIVGTRAARKAGVPRVLTGIRVADPRRWRTSLESYLTAAADRHVCVSQSVAEFSRLRGFAAEKLVVIPNGIDVQYWRHAQPLPLEDLQLARDRRVILYVGRLDDQKGLEPFFDQLPVVFSEFTEHDLVLVGDGPLRESLRHRAQRLGIASRVHFAGWRRDVPAVMAAADVVVLPSRWEGMPNVVLEAMAAGKVVIATQAEGTVELLGLGALEQTALVGDWTGLRGRLLHILRNPLLIKKLGEQNLSRAEQFSLDSMVTRYQRLYASLMESESIASAKNIFLRRSSRH